MLEDKYIGLVLAISSSLAIGTSFIITKKGLNDAADRSQNVSHHRAGAEASSRSRAGEMLPNYLQSPIWWMGITTMVIGEVCNFAAYTFAPAILVTPLGALSVIIGAILASVLLDERLGRLGVCGCAACLIGSVVIILHAPADKDVETVDEILGYASQPAFLLYVAIVAIVSSYMIYQVAPKHGTKNPIVYLTICSLVGSISVMAIKAFGIALKLTLAGNNQLTHASTYIFGIVVVFCIMIQMNYFNKALDTFSTNVVNPIYFVFFTTSTIIASAILFQGFNTTDGTNTVSLLCGFLIIFMGVYLLNVSREPEKPHPHTALDSGVMNPRMSMSGRISLDPGHGNIWGMGGNNHSQSTLYGADGTPLSATHGRRSDLYRAQNSTLFNAFEEEESVGLTQLREEEDETDEEEERRIAAKKKNTTSGHQRGYSVDGGGGGGKTSLSRGGGVAVPASPSTVANGRHHPGYARQSTDQV